MSAAATKQTTLKIVLIVLVVFIVGLWLANLKNSLVTNDEPNLSAESFTQTLNRNLEENSDLLNAPSETEKVFVNQLLVEANNLTTEDASGTPSVSVSTSTEAASGITDPGLVNSEPPNLVNPIKINCPAYVNCMPTFDAAPRPCVIPPGCEGVTEKVY